VVEEKERGEERRPRFAAGDLILVRVDASEANKLVHDELVRRLRPQSLEEKLEEVLTEVSQRVSALIAQTFGSSESVFNVMAPARALKEFTSSKLTLLALQVQEAVRATTSELEKELEEALRDGRIDERELAKLQERMREALVLALASPLAIAEASLILLSTLSATSLPPEMRPALFNEIVLGFSTVKSG